MKVRRKEGMKKVGWDEMSWECFKISFLVSVELILGAD